jgi:tRNA(Ile)-lysidine synthase TilS/MesJ
MKLYSIRPLMFVPEKDIISFKNKYELPVVKSPCPADENTKREYMKNLLKQLNKENPGVTDRMFKAILTSNIKGWTTPNIINKLK